MIFSEQLQRELIGFGLSTPFRRGAADFVAAGGEDLLRSMLGQVLGTRCSSEFAEGELPWRPEFGSLLHLIRHRNNDQVAEEMARVYVIEAVTRWIPQLRIKKVEIERKEGPGGELNVLLLIVTYVIASVNRSGAETLSNPYTTTVELSAA